MIKAKFGASVRSKTRTAQINEVLCKVICHNLCVLVQSIYELGIEPTFWNAKEQQASTALLAERCHARDCQSSEGRSTAGNQCG